MHAILTSQACTKQPHLPFVVSGKGRFNFNLSGDPVVSARKQSVSNPHRFNFLIAACSRCQEYAADGMNYIARSGYVLIINNYLFSYMRHAERSGSNDDVKNLKNLFDDFGFRYRVQDNQTRREMLLLLTDTSEKDFSKYDCFVCVILSHGSENGVHGADGEIICIETITSLFRRDECPSLEGKPKIFLFQACRGSASDRVAVEPVESDSDPPDLSSPSLPADADFLICFASSPGHAAYRQRSFGSWFLRAVFDVFKKHAKREHIMEMMVRVNHQVAGYCTRDGLKQMPCQVCMLTKKVFFQPRYSSS